MCKENEREADEKERERLEKKEAREADERERERNFELEKIRAMQINETESLASVRDERRHVRSLKSVIQNFDPEKAEISVYLTLFERQAEEFDIPEEQWISQLLPLLPINLAEIVLRESKSDPKNYKHIKEVLLNRLRVNAETFRKKFTLTQRTPDKLWKDLIFELNTYLEGWLNCLEITSFESLKDLMITDQIKRRTSPEIKDHFIDSWAKFVNPKELAEKLDDYESVREPGKKAVITEIDEENKFDKPRHKGKEKENKRSDTKPFNWKEKYENDQKEKYYEERRTPACYQCGSKFHLRPSCPLLRKKDEATESQVELVNHIASTSSLENEFSSYISYARVNNIPTRMLIDTGTNIDIIPRELVRNNQLTGDVIYLKQALENNTHCLKVAEVELDITGVGKIRTRAAVNCYDVEMKYYLLGNRTRKIIETKRKNLEAIKTKIKRLIGGTKSESNKQMEGARPPKRNHEFSPFKLKGEESLSRISSEKPKVMNYYPGFSRSKSSGKRVWNNGGKRSIVRKNEISENRVFFKTAGFIHRPDGTNKRVRVEMNEGRLNKSTIRGGPSPMLIV